ncbi:redoxin family protein [Escherichia coli]
MSQTVDFQGNPVTVANSIPQAGSKAQTFTLVAKDLSDVTLGQFAGKRKVLDLPSIDTGVCAASVRKFNQMGNEDRQHRCAVYLCHLPFAQSRFCGAEGSEQRQPRSPSPLSVKCSLIISASLRCGNC